MDIIKILLIVVSVFGVIGIVSYILEIRRYIDYLEKQVEKYHELETYEARKEQFL